MVELRKNRAKHKLAEGGIVTSVLGPSMTGDTIELFGLTGIDAIWLDAEHGPVDYADIGDLSRACDLWDKTSIVRVALNLPGVIYRTLDNGAQGIAVPHVNTAEEAQAVVDASKFAPVGARGSATSRQGLGVENFFEKANDETIVIILIEDIVAVRNLDEILKVDHIDVFYVAPGDLGQSMGHAGSYRHPDVTATLHKAVDQITAAGRVAGTLADESTVEDFIRRGVRFFSVGGTPWLLSGARSYVDKVSKAGASR